MGLQGIKLIVFDLDGTLARLKVDWTSMRTELSRKTGRDFSRISTALESLPRDKRGKSLEIIAKYETAHLSEIEPNGPLIDFITNSHSHRFGLLSNNTRRAVEAALSYVGIDSLFDCVLGADDVNHLKPSPEGLNVIMRKVQASSNETLFVGDTEADLATGKNAGVKTVDVGTFLREWVEFSK